MQTDVVLATIPCADENERLLLTLSHDSPQGTRLALVQQSFCPSIGWYTQKTLDLRPEQARRLRSALGVGAAIAVDSQDPTISLTTAVEDAPAVIPIRRDFIQAESA